MFYFVKFQSLIISSKNSVKELLPLVSKTMCIQNYQNKRDTSANYCLFFAESNVFKECFVIIIFKHVKNILKKCTNSLIYDYLNYQLTG